MSWLDPFNGESYLNWLENPTPVTFVKHYFWLLVYLLIFIIIVFLLHTFGGDAE